MSIFDDEETTNPFDTKVAEAKAAKVARKTAKPKNDADEWGSVPDGAATTGDDWGVVDLTAQKHDLPPPGWHAAKVADVKVTGASGDVLWCSIAYAIDGTPAMTSEMEPIAAKPTAPADKRQRVARGQIMLGRVQHATGVTLAGVKLPEIGERLIGKSCFVLIAHGDQYGVPVLNLRSVSNAPR
jgi:hypothetical protein